MYEVNEHGVIKEMTICNSKDSLFTFNIVPKLSKRTPKSKSDIINNVQALIFFYLHLQTLQEFHSATAHYYL